jgi:hypothetical protein
VFIPPTNIPQRSPTPRFLSTSLLSSSLAFSCSPPASSYLPTN